MKTYEEILNGMKEKYKELSGVEAHESSDIGIRLRVLAGEIYSLQSRLSFIERQSFYESATGEYLDHHANQYGLKRREAAKAKGKLVFFLNEPLDYILNIPAGAVCAAGDSLRFVTVNALSIAPGFTAGTVEAEAESGGTEYNCAPNTITSLVVVPSVISSVTNMEAFSGGTDIESDEKLRERLIDFCSFIPSGANENFYKNIAYQVSGINSVSVENGENSEVKVYVYGKNENVPQALLEELQNLYDEKKTIGTKVTVQNAKIYNYTLYLDITPDSCSIENARQSVIDIMNEYFDKLNIGDPVYRSALGAVLMDKAPIKNYRFPSALADFAGDKGTIAVLVSCEVGEI